MIENNFALIYSTTLLAVFSAFHLNTRSLARSFVRPLYFILSVFLSQLHNSRRLDLIAK